MPIFMDRHDVRDATAEAVAAAHQEDRKSKRSTRANRLLIGMTSREGRLFA